MSQTKQRPPAGKKTLLWTLALILIAALSIWAVTGQLQSFSLESFAAYLRGVNAGWIALAIGCMLAYIYFEGAALNAICRGFGHGRGMRQAFVYSAADIYFSAITPSATGGQPASAYFMMRDGIPGPVTTVALLVNLILYTLSIMCIGLFCFVARPGVFLGYGALAKTLIVAGFTVQAGLVFFFALLLKREKLLHRICDGALKLLGRLHLIRKPNVKRVRLNAAIEDYRRSAAMMGGQRAALAKGFLLNLAQRSALICVSMCAFRAMGGDAARMLDAWCVQGFATLGYNFVPVPGAVGVADLMMLDGFGQLMNPEAAVHLELLSRALSFYSCILICGGTALIAYFTKREGKYKG